MPWLGLQLDRGDEGQARKSRRQVCDRVGSEMVEGRREEATVLGAAGEGHWRGDGRE